MKSFGADDHDALSDLSKLIHIEFVSADYLGFDISRKRVDDMGFKLTFVPSNERVHWIDINFGLADTIYMGDGVYDALIFEKVGYSICPSDGFYRTLQKANFVTYHKGGHRAVADACLHIKEKFFCTSSVY
jgi:3-deoxy-D-manno-octulosonate 8-phosphate phosphatase (KDO 8-P phosphatase)